MIERFEECKLREGKRPHALSSAVFAMPESQVQWQA